MTPSAGRRAGLLLAILIAARDVHAQPGWSELQASPAVFEVAGVPTDKDRSQVMLQLIRLVHSLPAGHEAADALRERIAALVIDIDALQNAAARAPKSEINLSLATTRDGREVLKGALEAAGFRLRERNKAYRAEIENDRDDAERRARLAMAGIDTAALAASLNAGQSIAFTPTSLTVPLPLPAATWTDAIFQAPVPPRALFGAIIRDRNASLLYYGLTALKPGTREYLRQDADLLRWIYREHPGSLAAFGGSIRVANGRMDVPGGEAARALWESIVDEPVTKPDEFVKKILGHDAGRLAYFYDTIDQLDPPRQRFALGLWIKDSAIRAERFRTLYRAFAEVDPEWSLTMLPFSRPLNDAGALLQTVRVTDEGVLAAPTHRKLWRVAFDSTDFPDDPSKLVRNGAEDGELDAGALAEMIVLVPAQVRRMRLEAFAFAQRVFAGADEKAVGDVLIALRGYARFPVLLLSLERSGIASPATYAAMCRHAEAIERVDEPARQLSLLAQFQGAVGLVDRFTRTGRLDAASAERLVLSLAALLPEGSDGYHGLVADWIDRNLLPAVNDKGTNGTKRTVEQSVVASLADAEPRSDRVFEWEGMKYVVSIASAEARRLEAIRTKQAGNTLDEVLAFSRDARALAAADIDLERIKSLAATLKSHALALKAPKPWPGMQAGDTPELQKAVDRATKDLAKLKKPKDVSKAARIAVPLGRTADYLLGEVLVALAYATHLGDPETVLGGEADVSHAHDFGIASTPSGEGRRRAPWLRPRQELGKAVTGSLLGLDLALSRLALRRLSSDRMPDLPRLNLNDRDTFSETIALMNPRRFTDSDIANVAAAIREGRRRVADAARDPAALDHLAASVRLSPTRRQLLAWTAAHDVNAVANLLSMAEFLELGRSAAGEIAHLDAFGLTDEPLTGCFCMRYPVAGPWEPYSGRPASGLLASRVPDLTLRVAEVLDDLKAPAALLPAVLAMAAQDFIDEAPTMYSDDWPSLVAQARSVARERVEDYVAALTAGGPLRPQSTSVPR